MLSLAERIFLIEHVFRENGKYTNVVEDRFRQQFPNSILPHRNAVRDLINKFRETGSVADAARSGRPSLLTDEKLSEMSDKMLRSPKKSIRQLARESDVGYATAYKGVRKTLGLYPYKVKAVQLLKETDYLKRIQYCNWFNNFVQINGKEVLDITFYSDEAWFHLSGYVNSQNSRLWSAVNPFEIHEQPLHSLKVGVWIAMSRRRIIGSIFFDGTINSERYIDIILSNFVDQLTDYEKSHSTFQQDGATAHTYNRSLQWLRNIFGDRIISKNLWPPRSPDYYFWGAAKAVVYKNKPQTLQELRNEIVNFVNSITPDELLRVFDNKIKRVNECIRSKGGHFQHYL